MTVPHGGYLTDGGAPGAPPGPGVAPPFAAPPTDRNTKGLWVGLGVGGLVLLLCCVGGIAGLVVLTAGGNRIVESEARAVVSQFLGSLVREDYLEAYDVVCSDYTEENSIEAFEQRASSPTIERFTIDAVDVTDAGDIVATASLGLSGGVTQTRDYPLVQDMDGLKVCGGF